MDKIGRPSRNRVKNKQNLERANEAKKRKLDVTHQCSSASTLDAVPVAVASNKLQPAPVHSKVNAVIEAPSPALTDSIFLGRRIISCSSLTAAFKQVSEHASVCSRVDVTLKNELRVGLRSEAIYSCRCGWEVIVQSDTGSEQYPINDGLAWGCVNASVGHDDLCSLLTCIDVPPPSFRSHKKTQDTVQSTLLEALEKNLKEAGEEEKRLAIEANDFAVVSGVSMPFISVYVDGGWAVRSYSHSYTSNYGHAAIIGVRSKKVLFVGMRQKCCYLCTKYTNLGRDPPTHQCYKNWSKSSTAMESDILKEGFANSIGAHQLVYLTFIGDGDSSVFHNVKNVYEGIEVRKIECINHIIRNVNSKLTQASSSGKNKWQITQNERRIAGMERRFNEIGRLLHITSRHFNSLGNFDDNHSKLSTTIRNITEHIFGNHLLCESFYCDQVGKEEGDYNNSKSLAIYRAVAEILSRPAGLSRSMIECRTSNVVESFMSTVAKHIEGKRKNLGGMGLYNLKICAAALSFNTTPFFSADATKYLTAKSPNLLWKKKRLAAQKRRRSGGNSKHKPRALRFNFLKPKGDADYGESPMKPDCPDNELSALIMVLKNSLQVDQEQQAYIESVTILQSDSPNDLWFFYRRSRITASHAGKIFKLRDTTDNTSTIKLITGKIHLVGVAAINVKYGKDHEKIAIRKYEEVMGLEPGTIKESGFIVCLEAGIFGCSPDGLNNLDFGLVEVKCPISIKDKDPNLWYEVSSSPLHIKDGVVKLRRSHDHFYQVVMQLMVSGRAYCDYFVWTNVGYFCERVFKKEAEDTWAQMMPKLLKFWTEDLAPELVDSRLARGFKTCRLPQYRRTAIENLKEKSVKKSAK